MRGEILLAKTAAVSQIKRLPVHMRKVATTVTDTRTLDAAFVGVEKRVCRLFFCSLFLFFFISYISLFFSGLFW